MKILVTGATGFVGSHIAAALMGDGHDLRLLVRRPEQVSGTFAPHGVEPSDLVTGDVRDRAAVEQALDGCDAVVHAAAIYSLDPRRAAEVQSTNEEAAQVVLGTAASGGLDPIVHISSTVVLTGGAGGGPELRLGTLDRPYALSKRRSEEVARALQDRGAPVVSIYPGGCLGPDDPYLGDQTDRLRWILRGMFPMWARGGYHVTDVRTVAQVVARAMQPHCGPRRFVVPGTHVDGSTLYDTLADVTGRRFRHVILPAVVLRPMTASIDLGQRLLPRRWHYPGDQEAALLVLADSRMDDTAARRQLGVEPPPLAETLRDTVAWMAQAGHISRRAAGRALQPVA